MIYLDTASTTAADPEILQKTMEIASEYPGNPSSIHSAGKEAKKILEESREKCAEILNCSRDRIFFTSGGTESNSIVLLSFLRQNSPGNIISSSIEHASISGNLKTLASFGWNIKNISPEENGVIDPQKFKKIIDSTDGISLVTVMYVNNEIGSIQPVKELAEIIREKQKKEGRKIHFHTDMVQAAGKLPLNLDKMGIDSASFSAHKLFGPKGSGLLYLKNKNLNPLNTGGGQEKGIRPGTENISFAYAFSGVLEKYGTPDEQKRKKIINNTVWLTEQLKKIRGIKLIPETRDSFNHLFVPGIVSFSVPPVPGEVLARVLDNDGFAVSTGSACSNNRKGKISSVLKSIKIPEKTAAGMIRVSFSTKTERNDLELFVESLEKNISVLGKAVGIY